VAHYMELRKEHPEKLVPATRLRGPSPSVAQALLS
jgi:hypothetical protein